MVCRGGHPPRLLQGYSPSCDVSSITRLTIDPRAAEAETWFAGTTMKNGTTIIAAVASMPPTERPTDSPLVNAN